MNLESLGTKELTFIEKRNIEGGSLILFAFFLLFGAVIGFVLTEAVE